MAKPWPDFIGISGGIVPAWFPVSKPDYNQTMTQDRDDFYTPEAGQEDQAMQGMREMFNRGEMIPTDDPNHWITQDLVFILRGLKEGRSPTDMELKMLCCACGIDHTILCGIDHTIL
jgi:hypothetical protein